MLAKIKSLDFSQCQIQRRSVGVLLHGVYCNVIPAFGEGAFALEIPDVDLKAWILIDEIKDSDDMKL